MLIEILKNIGDTYAVRVNPNAEKGWLYGQIFSEHPENASVLSGRDLWWGIKLSKEENSVTFGMVFVQTLLRNDVSEDFLISLLLEALEISKKDSLFFYEQDLLKQIIASLETMVMMKVHARTNFKVETDNSFGEF